MWYSLWPMPSICQYNYGFLQNSVYFVVCKITISPSKKTRAMSRSLRAIKLANDSFRK